MGEKHEHGTMDTKVQEETFAGTIRVSKYVVIGSIAFLVFLAIVNS